MGAENFRTDTGKGVIPTYTTISGTLTTNATKTTFLDYAGAVTAQTIFGVDLQLALANNLYVYENASTNGSVRKIVGVHTNGTAWSIEVESAFDSPLAAENLKLITANLNDYSVANEGGSDGILDGKLFVAGATVHIEENSNRRMAKVHREAKAFNATGTTFLITELK